MPYNIPGGAFDVTVTMVYITIWTVVAKFVIMSDKDVVGSLPSVAVNECCFLLCLLLFGTSIFRQTTQLVSTFLLWRPCSSRARSRVYVNYCILIRFTADYEDLA